MVMGVRRLLGCSIPLLAACATGPAGSYEVIDLGVLPGHATCQAFGINNQSEVVGTCQVNEGSGEVHGFVWREGVGMTQLPTPAGGYTDTLAQRINAKGEVAGWARSLAVAQRAFLWTAGGAVDLGTLPGGTFSEAYDVNNKGQVVGWTNTGPGTDPQAFVWKAGTMSALPSLPGASLAQARAIANNGKAAGLSDSATSTGSAVVWSGGTVTDLGPLGMSQGLIAFDLSESGHVVGWSSDAERAFRWRSGTMTALPFLPGGFESRANAVNNGGLVVGNANDPGVTRAVAWAKDDAIVDLNTRIADVSWELREARDVNEHGEIAGVGLHSGDQRAFLLRPQ